MLFKLKNVKDQFAIGLRWAVDSRQGIEQIQFNNNLNYGVIAALKDKSFKRLKVAALTDDTYDKSICLAGLFAKAFDNLIFIHRLSDSLYWLCIVKEGEVWSGVDVDKATAGDYVDNYDAIKALVDVAVQDFEANGIEVASCLKCTDTAFSEFPQCENVDFFTLISKARKYKRQFIIRYLEPHKVIKQKIILVIIILVVFGSVSYFVYRNHIVHILLHNQEVQEEKRKAAALKAEQEYFKSIESKVRKQWGSAVIKNIMSLFNHLPLQSKGWSVTKISYVPSEPNTLKISLQRSSFGTLNSFIYAYTPAGQDGDVAKDNNSGSKTIQIDNGKLESQEGFTLNRSTITDKIPKNLYALISFMQVRQDLFDFRLGAKQQVPYGVHLTSFELSGSALWQLIQLEMAFEQFPTLVINNIDFMVTGYDMSWQLKGEIYA